MIWGSMTWSYLNILLGGIFKLGQQPVVNKMRTLELLCLSIEELVRSNGVKVLEMTYCMRQEDPSLNYSPWEGRENTIIIVKGNTDIFE